MNRDHRSPSCALTITFLTAALILLSCGCRTVAVERSTWRDRFEAELPVFGHRNWIVIADSAYPAQTSPGVETVFTGDEQVAVVASVIEALARTRHVRPVVYLDAELAAVPETLAPGVTTYRTELERVLAGQRVLSAPHDDLIARLDTAGKTFRVLILKTGLTIPYSSVFIELDCGYWGPEAERQLREAMANLR